ncbi:MAG TPA: hypothetical protein VLN08_04335, partial [Vicinamibacterales bacterium]|nr:hypothetical protein [Vicinamibacterales bacterium]
IWAPGTPGDSWRDESAPVTLSMARYAHWTDGLPRSKISSDMHTVVCTITMTSLLVFGAGITGMRAQGPERSSASQGAAAK